VADTDEGPRPDSSAESLAKLRTVFAAKGSVTAGNSSQMSDGAAAVIRTCDLDPSKVNPLGGAIALGHPLGATGAVRTATIVHGMRRRKQKYGMVTMCIGTGMGAAGVFEAL
jgi:acetyl-CoA acetyltransferase